MSYGRVSLSDEQKKIADKYKPVSEDTMEGLQRAAEVGTVQPVSWQDAISGTKRSFERLGQTVGSGLLGTVGSVMNAAGHVVDASITDPNIVDPKAVARGDYAALNNSLAEYERERQRTAQSIYSEADHAAEVSAQLAGAAKDGLGKGGQFLVDAGIAGTQMAGDIAAGGLTGLGALPFMGIRSFGGGTQEARLSGANTDQQFLYGLSSAAVEVGTEKLSNVSKLFRSAFGKGRTRNCREKYNKSDIFTSWFLCKNLSRTRHRPRFGRWNPWHGAQ